MPPRTVMKDGWFYTGDLGRMDDAGRITITGRKKEMIVLASGKNIYPEEIETHYRQSPFVKEICVMGLAEPGRPIIRTAVSPSSCPNMDLLRERKIVNAGDIMRFEIEGLPCGLPAHKRVLGYDIWFEPLPRTTTQKMKRHEIERRVRERQRIVAAGPRCRSSRRRSGVDGAAASVSGCRRDQGAREAGRTAYLQTRTSSSTSASIRWSESSC